VRLHPGTTKNREGRTYPFTDELEQLLRAQYAEQEQLRQVGRVVRAVFHRNGKPIRTFRRSWRSACRAAGVPGRILHDFRRHAGFRIMPSSGLEGCLLGPLMINLALAKSA
jgi:integrase